MFDNDLAALVRDIGVMAGALTTITVALVAIARYFIIKPLKAYIDKATAQLKPNGGGHLADAINRTDERVDQLVTGQEKVLDIMMKHLQDHASSQK